MKHVFAALAFAWFPLVGACAATSEDSGEQVDGESVQQSLLGHTMVLPRGFAINVFAENLGGLRFMALGPDGAIYASRMGAGLIVKMTDTNRDGVADGAPVTVQGGLDHPHGIAFRGDTMYVAEEGRVVRFLPGGGATQTIVGGIPQGGHNSRTIVFKGDTLFLSVGSSCNVCEESDPRRAAVTAYHPDGSGEQVYARGLRNSVGLAVHPQTGELWATNNDRDHLSDDLPPDRVNILQRNGFYGWPNCYLPGKANPEYASNSSVCSSAIAPAVELTAHSAPLGLTFYTGNVFPSQYRGALFIAQHGSWNRSSKSGYIISWVPVQDGKPGGAARRFVSGWLVGQSEWGRPVDVLTAPDGSLLISDDANGRIYRVAYQG